MHRHTYTEGQISHKYTRRHKITHVLMKFTLQTVSVPYSSNSTNSTPSKNQQRTNENNDDGERWTRTTPSPIPIPTTTTTTMMMMMMMVWRRETRNKKPKINEFFCRCWWCSSAASASVSFAVGKAKIGTGIAINQTDDVGFDDFLLFLLFLDFVVYSPIATTIVSDGNPNIK